MHNALYRKYRPTTFEGIIGQSHITRTLQNQITNGKLGHAYLFCGSRGTGKTSVAKIFARAVNCQNPRDGSPCGECAVCIGLQNPNAIDIMEIDAASNNKADEIREIREEIKFLPAIGKYKVYIIDEVHMLTDSAFNALLKTLEEPPAHVIFVLATTEPHRLPPTILSRCLRFDFRLVAPDEMSKLLESVLGEEGKKYQAEAVRYIASRGEGSVRDMLSIADMCLSFGDELKLDNVLMALGSTDRRMIIGLVEAIRDGDCGAILDIIDDIATGGKSMVQAARDVASLLRDLAVIKSTPSPQNILVETEQSLNYLKSKASEFSIEFLLSALTVFTSIDAELRYSVAPRIVVETAALTAARRLGDDLSSLYERLTRLESGAVAPQSAPPASPPTRAPKAPLDPQAILGQMATYLRQNDKQIIYYQLIEIHEASISDGKLIIQATPAQFDDLTATDTRAVLDQALQSLNVPLRLEIVKNIVVDKESAIARLKRMIGDTPLNISK